MGANVEVSYEQTGVSARFIYRGPHQEASTYILIRLDTTLAVEYFTIRLHN
jgi:hypothetical protein